MGESFVFDNTAMKSSSSVVFSRRTQPVSQSGGYSLSRFDHLTPLGSELDGVCHAFA